MKCSVKSHLIDDCEFSIKCIPDTVFRFDPNSKEVIHHNLILTFTFMHLADTFIQSDLHCIQVTVSTFYQLLLSLGIEPMILALLAPCATI